VGEERILAAHELAGALQNDVGSVVFGALTYQLGASAEVLLVEHLQDPVSGRSRNLVEVLDGVLQEIPETLLLLPYFELLKVKKAYLKNFEELRSVQLEDLGFVLEGDGEGIPPRFFGQKVHVSESFALLQLDRKLVRHLMDTLHLCDVRLRVEFAHR